MAGWVDERRGVVLTVKPGNGDTFKEHKEQQAHATGRVVIEKFEDINAPLQEEKEGECRSASPQHPVHSASEPEEAGIRLHCSKKA